MALNTFADARKEAIRKAKKENKDFFILCYNQFIRYGTYKEVFEITDKMPCLGKWHHVYPDGLIIRRG